MSSMKREAGAGATETLVLYERVDISRNVNSSPELQDRI